MTSEASLFDKLSGELFSKTISFLHPHDMLNLRGVSNTLLVNAPILLENASVISLSFVGCNANDACEVYDSLLSYCLETHLGPVYKNYSISRVFPVLFFYWFLLRYAPGYKSGRFYRSKVYFAPKREEERLFAERLNLARDKVELDVILGSVGDFSVQIYGHGNGTVKLMMDEEVCQSVPINNIKGELDFLSEHVTVIKMKLPYFVLRTDGRSFDTYGLVKQHASGDFIFNEASLRRTVLLNPSPRSLFIFAHFLCKQIGKHRLVITISSQAVINDINIKYEPDVLAMKAIPGEMYNNVDNCKQMHEKYPQNLFYDTEAHAEMNSLQSATSHTMDHEDSDDDEEEDE